MRAARQSPYADRVVGYHLASGTTEEWMIWGGNEGKWVDFSPANVVRFRKWLREKYRAAGALESAWADPAVTFESATIPTKRQREATRLATLRDPERERRVIDFYDYNADLVADTIGCPPRCSANWPSRRACTATCPSPNRTTSSTRTAVWWRCP